MLGERELPLSILPAFGVPYEELRVLKCIEKGQGDQFLEEFSFPGGLWRNFACTCSHFVVRANAPCSAFLGTGSCSPLISVVVVLCVFVYSWLLWSCSGCGFFASCDLKQSCWGLCVCVCVYRNSRLENETLVGSKSFLKVWEYRPEKGREIFLKLYQCFTWTRIAGRAYRQSGPRISVAAWQSVTAVKITAVH